MALPGIGRSTAGAILALAHDRPFPILDGNVKRVLCRFHGIDAWPGSVEKELWKLAADSVPVRGAAAYTQAIMDLGATVCLRRRPLCSACPLMQDCRALRDGITDQLPVAKPRAPTPLRQAVFVFLENEAGELLLLRRPPAGIWGGLWSVPECPPGRDAADWVQEEFGCRIAGLETYPTLRHTFSHFRLDIRPERIRIDGAAAIGDADGQVWLQPKDAIAYGVPAPVRRLILEISASRETLNGKNGEVRKAG